MSTTVARGRAKGVAVRTGTKTEVGIFCIPKKGINLIYVYGQIGKISTAIQKDAKKKVKTPIQKKLTKLGHYLVGLAILLCALVVIIGVAWKKNVKDMINIGLRFR